MTPKDPDVSRHTEGTTWSAWAGGSGSLGLWWGMQRLRADSPKVVTQKLFLALWGGSGSVLTVDLASLLELYLHIARAVLLKHPEASTPSAS